MSEFGSSVQAAGRKKLLFLSHAITQTSRPDRNDYPEDARGHSCLMLGAGESGRPVHVVCAPKGDYLAIVTA
jgi:hypothetical protein